MHITRFHVIGMTLLALAGCGDENAILDPPPPAPSDLARSADPAASRAQRIQTSGQFAAVVNFATLTLTPRGRNCLLEVEGQLNFTGTIVGSAVGQTSALVFAPCSEVATTPPGTFRDVFKSELKFDGRVAGQPASANVLYLGRVQPGGNIEGRIVFSRGVQGRLEIHETIVAVGGEYSGSVVLTPAP